MPVSALRHCYDLLQCAVQWRRGYWTAHWRSSFTGLTGENVESTILRIEVNCTLCCLLVLVHASFLLPYLTISSLTLSCLLLPCLALPSLVTSHHTQLSQHHQHLMALECLLLLCLGGEMNGLCWEAVNRKISYESLPMNVIKSGWLFSWVCQRVFVPPFGSATHR